MIPNNEAPIEHNNIAAKAPQSPQANHDVDQPLNLPNNELLFLPLDSNNIGAITNPFPAPKANPYDADPTQAISCRPSP